MTETILMAGLLYLGLCGMLWLGGLMDGAGKRFTRRVPGVALVFLAGIGVLMRLLG